MAQFDSKLVDKAASTARQVLPEIGGKYTKLSEQKITEIKGQLSRQSPKYNNYPVDKIMLDCNRLMSSRFGNAAVTQEGVTTILADLSKEHHAPRNIVAEVVIAVLGGASSPGINVSELAKSLTDESDETE